MQSFSEYLEQQTHSQTSKTIQKPKDSIYERARDLFFQEHRESIQASIGELPAEREDIIIKALWDASTDKQKYIDKATNDKTTEDLFAGLIDDENTFGDHSIELPQITGDTKPFQVKYQVKPLDSWPEHFLDGLFVCSTHLPRHEWDKNNISKSDRIALALKIMQTYVSMSN